MRTLIKIVLFQFALILGITSNFLRFLTFVGGGLFILEELMAKRERNTPVFFRVTEKEREIIDKKMNMVGVYLSSQNGDIWVYDRN